MVAGTLYTYPENFRAYKALIAAQYSGAQVTIAKNFEFGKTNQTPEFLKKFPLGKVPAFEGADGTWLFESNAIAYYVATESLRGKTLEAQAAVQQWMNFADNEILPASCTWVFPCLGIMQYNKQNTDRAKEDVQRALAVLNAHLLTRTYLVGERISLADIAVCCNLLQLYAHVLEPEFRAPYGNVTRWFVTLVNQPQFAAVVGAVALCEKMAQFDAKKFAELQGKGAGGKAEGGKKKEAQPKKEQPKKEEKPKKEAKPAEDDDDDGVPREPKSKDPFDACPPTAFNWDAWKKCFSNNKNKPDVYLPYFWENMDWENCSIWRGDYMYNSELSKGFMASNLLKGMIQRLDKMRKHSFGVLCLFGEPNNYVITQFWVWRGQGLAFDLSEDTKDDSTTYNWTKLDHTTDETKSFVNTFMKCNDDVEDVFYEGKICADCKVYK